MKRNYPLLPFCRYADDGVVHCRTESEARAFRKALEQRFNECKLELHPEKTRIVYCKSSDRKKDYPVVSFDFLGFTFRPCRPEAARS
jgi:RNA-directed DNA polymerase